MIKPPTVVHPGPFNRLPDKRIPLEVRLNDDGTLDEVVAGKCGLYLHLEQMGDDCWSLIIEDGPHYLNISLDTNRRAHIRGAIIDHFTTALGKDHRARRTTARLLAGGRAMMSSLNPTTTPCTSFVVRPGDESVCDRCGRFRMDHAFTARP
jgi:hypothetical protein